MQFNLIHPKIKVTYYISHLFAGVLIHSIFTLLMMGGNTKILVFIHSLILLCVLLMAIKSKPGHQIRLKWIMLGLFTSQCFCFYYYDPHKNSTHVKIGDTVEILKFISEKVDTAGGLSDCTHEDVVRLGVNQRLLLDAFTGNVFHFSVKGDRCMISSVGADRKYEDGKSFDLGNLVFLEGSYMWVLPTVYRWYYSDEEIYKRLSGDLFIKVNIKSNDQSF